MSHPKLYALLVGINTYARPLLPNLKYTHQDVQHLQNYLETQQAKHFDLDIQVLQDEAATRKNILQGLEQHLGQAQKGEVALFFFAGLGSWQQAHPDLAALDNNSLEKTLVCHDSRMPKVYDLSEKEWLVLVNYITRNQATMVMLLDTCHNTSFESYPGQATRLVEGLNKHRKLEHYLYDVTVPTNKFYYYKKQLQHHSIKALPAPSYVCYQACEQTEYATENQQGGHFTQALLASLTNSSTPLTYAQVHHTLLGQLLQHPAQQTPLLEAYHHFNVHQIFLTNAPSHTPLKRFKVYKEQGKMDYTIQLGAQLGFPMDLQAPIGVQLYPSSNSTQKVGTGAIQFIGLSSSPIHLSLPSMDYQEVYWAELLDFTVNPLLIGFVGAAADGEALQALLEQQGLPQLVLMPNNNHCPFSIQWEESRNCYQLLEKDRAVFIVEFTQEALSQASLMTMLLNTLEHLYQWRQTIHLHHSSSAIPQEDILLTFTPSPIALDRVQCTYTHQGVQHHISLAQAHQAPQKAYEQVILPLQQEETIEYTIKLMNTSFTEHYYVAYLLISANYGVFPLEFNLPLAARDSIDNLINPNYSTLSIPHPAEEELTNYLQVLISREKIPTIEHFMLPELELEQSLAFALQTRMIGPKRKRLFDWQAFRLDMVLEKH